MKCVGIPSLFARKQTRSVNVELKLQRLRREAERVATSSEDEEVLVKVPVVHELDKDMRMVVRERTAEEESMREKVCM